MELRYLDNKLLTQLNESEARWAKVAEKAEKDCGTFSVVIIGQQNNGKSTLCNALIQDWNNQRFPVSDIRQTEDIQEAHDADSNITYVDTPGFGTSCASDTLRAQDEWLRANLLVFVHSVRSGELDADEVATLQTLKSVIPHLDQRIFIVCSKFGDENRGHVAEVLNVIKNQIKQIISDSVPVEAVDSLFYQHGKYSNDERLMNLSNMHTILKWIDEHMDIQSPLIEIIQKERETYISILKSVKKKMLSSLTDHHIQKQTYHMDMIECWRDNKKRIEISWNNCAQYRSSSDTGSILAELAVASAMIAQAVRKN